MFRWLLILVCLFAACFAMQSINTHADAGWIFQRQEASTCSNGHCGMTPTIPAIPDQVKAKKPDQVKREVAPVVKQSLTAPDQTNCSTIPKSCPCLGKRPRILGGRIVTRWQTPWR